ncbi:MAG: response regulator, partial [Thermodesulfobacteriota bacterium]
MKRILVVDDEESIRFLYKEELEEEGFVVECA